MKREKIESILWTFMIIVLLSLTFRIENRAEELSCRQCNVVFQNKIVGGEYVDFGEYNIQELYEELSVNNTCVLDWNPTQGYSISYNAPR